MRKRFLPLLGLALFLLSGSAFAQRYANNPTQPNAYNSPEIYIEGGFSLGTGIAGLRAEDVGPGLGLNAALGVRFNPVLAFEGSVGSALHINPGENVANVSYLDGALKLYAPTVGRAEVYLRLGAGGYALADNQNAVSAGLGASAGLGYEYRVGRTGYFGITARAHFIQFADAANNQLALGDVSFRGGFVF